MWAQARYDLGLTTEEFWRLTPRMYHMLFARHREALLHREMVAAFTTAAVVNFSMGAPKQPVPPVRFMPNHPDSGAAATPGRVNRKAVAEGIRAFFGPLVKKDG